MLKWGSRSTPANSKSWKLKGFRTMTETWSDGNIWTKRSKMVPADSMSCKISISLGAKAWEVQLSTLLTQIMKLTKEAISWNIVMMLANKEMAQEACTWKWVVVVSITLSMEMQEHLWNSGKANFINLALNHPSVCMVIFTQELQSFVLVVVLLEVNALSKKKWRFLILFLRIKLINLNRLKATNSCSHLLCMVE